MKVALSSQSTAAPTTSSSRHSRESTSLVLAGERERNEDEKEKRCVKMTKCRTASYDFVRGI